MGLYHAEVIDKIGALVGGLTYGVKADTSIKHFQEAMKLPLLHPLRYIELGNGMLMMYGKKRAADVVKAYEAAMALKPADAMEALISTRPKANWRTNHRRKQRPFNRAELCSAAIVF